MRRLVHVRALLALRALQQAHGLAATLYTARAAPPALHARPAETGTCRGLTPLVFPNYGASSAFVYHPNAVAQWRRHVVSTALSGLVPPADRAAFAKLWDDVAGLQLGATLQNLPPASEIGLFPVTINTAPYWG